MVQTTQQSDVIVPGSKVFLGQMRKDLAPLYRKWANDLRVGTKLGVISRHAFPLTDEQELDWFQSISASETNAVFGIYEKSTGEPIGYSSLGGLGSTHRAAEFGIAIGEQSFRGRGYGTEATKLTLDYGFTVLGLHCIWLNCASINHAALKAYQRAGFSEAGRVREAGQLAGQRYDAVLMDILAGEFESPVLKEMLGLNDTPR